MLVARMNAVVNRVGKRIGWLDQVLAYVLNVFPFDTRLEPVVGAEPLKESQHVYHSTASARLTPSKKTNR